jgi:hypothetical protein
LFTGGQRSPPMTGRSRRRAGGCGKLAGFGTIGVIGVRERRCQGEVLWMIHR